MPKVTVSVPHQLDPDEAMARSRPVVEKTVKDFEGHDLEANWSERAAEFSFKSMAFTIKGHVAIEDAQVTVDIDLPFAAMMFKDRVHKAVTKNLTRALES